MQRAPCRLNLCASGFKAVGVLFLLFFFSVFFFLGGGEWRGGGLGDCLYMYRCFSSFVYVWVSFMVSVSPENFVEYRFRPSLGLSGCRAVSLSGWTPTTEQTLTRVEG